MAIVNVNAMLTRGLRQLFRTASAGPQTTKQCSILTLQLKIFLPTTTISPQVPFQTKESFFVPPDVRLNLHLPMKSN